MRYLTLLLFTALLTACTSNISDPLTPPGDANQPNGELVYVEDEALQEKIAAIGEEAKGKLGVFALLMEDERAVSFNGNDHFAMQSVVKLPVSILVMQQMADAMRQEQRPEPAVARIAV